MVPHREEWKSLCVLGRSCDILDSKSAVNLRAVVVVSAPKKVHTRFVFRTLMFVHSLCFFNMNVCVL